MRERGFELDEPPLPFQDAPFETLLWLYALSQCNTKALKLGETRQTIKVSGKELGELLKKYPAIADA